MGRKASVKCLSENRHRRVEGIEPGFQTDRLVVQVIISGCQRIGFSAVAKSDGKAVQRLAKPCAESEIGGLRDHLRLKAGDAVSEASDLLDEVLGRRRRTEVGEGAL